MTSPTLLIRRVAGATAGLLLAAAPVAGGEDCAFGDDFDDYTADEIIVGNGASTWEAWDADDRWEDAHVRDTLSRSGENSVEIDGSDDIVQLLTDVNTGVWEVSAWVYVPSDYTGNQFFILLNEYGHGGPYNWSTQVWIDGTGWVRDSDNPGTGVPLVRNDWVEVKVRIDFDNDMQTVTYGGAELFTDSWTEHVSGGGTLNLAAIDLFNSGGSEVYWDDVNVCPASASCTGDFDDDGAVTFGDLVIFLSAWGGSGPQDLDGDGTVTFGDLILLLGLWGPCP